MLAKIANTVNTARRKAGSVACARRKVNLNPHDNRMFSEIVADEPKQIKIDAAK